MAFVFNSRLPRRHFVTGAAAAMTLPRLRAQQEPAAYGLTALLDGSGHAAPSGGRISDGIGKRRRASRGTISRCVPCISMRAIIATLTGCRPRPSGNTPVKTIPPAWPNVRGTRTIPEATGSRWAVNSRARAPARHTGERRGVGAGWYGRVTARNCEFPVSRVYNVGFRVVRISSRPCTQMNADKKE
jgi:hypothetical protein